MRFTIYYQNVHDKSPQVFKSGWPAWRKRIAALCEKAKASGDQEMVDLCYLADSGEDEDAVATIVQYLDLDDIAEESEQ